MKISIAFSLVCIFVFNATSEIFHNPVLYGADPSCTFYNGFYYYMQTDGGLNVRKAPRLVGSTGLGAATAISVFTPSAPYNQGIEAPEIKYINGNWYIYYSAGEANDPGDITHRMFCLKASTADPQGPYTFVGEVYDPNDNLWALDGNILQKDDGALYFVWSGRSSNVAGPTSIYIAPMSNPWTISGSRVRICNPTYSWENGINEAPAIIEHNGKISIVYSANCSCGNDYCMGVIGNTDGNVLNPGSWSKNATPIFQSYAGTDGNVYAPGSCTFTKSLDGSEDWILFHTAQYNGAGYNREIHAQKFTWYSGYNTPDLGVPYPDGDGLVVPSGEAPILTTTRKSQIQLQDGRMAAFICQYPDGSVWTSSENTPSGTWGPWSSVGSGSGFRRLDVLQRPDGTLILYGVGDMTSVWINWQNASNGPWSGFQSLGGTLNDVKAFRYNDGRNAVFAMDGNQIWANAQISSNGAWGGWESFPGTGFTYTAPLKLPDERFVMFACGNKTQVWMNTQTNYNGGWTGWQSMGGFDQNVCAFRYNDGRLAIFTGDGTYIYANAQISTNGLWGGWEAFPSTGFTDYSPIKLADERFALLAINGGSIYQNIQTNYNGGWSGWTSLGGSGFSKINGGQLFDERLFYFGNATGSPQWFRYQAVSNGDWNVGWTNLGATVY